MNPPRAAVAGATLPWATVGLAARAQGGSGGPRRKVGATRHPLNFFGMRSHKKSQILRFSRPLMRPVSSLEIFSRCAFGLVGIGLPMAGNTLRIDMHLYRR
jgi:hypothetical protein